MILSQARTITAIAGTILVTAIIIATSELIATILEKEQQQQ